MSVLLLTHRACLHHDPTILRHAQRLASSVHYLEGVRALAYHAVVNNKSQSLNLIGVTVSSFVVVLQARDGRDAG